MNYWERWIGDWKRKTAHLSAEAKGVYGELLDHEYATQRPLPLDREDIYRLAGARTTSECRSADKVLAEFYTKTETGYFNKRAQEEIAKRAEYTSAQRERANKRWGNPDPATGEVKPRVNGHKITFDFDKGIFTGIDELQLLAWQDAYPALIIDPEVARAAAWVKANPANRKQNYARFLVNWFSKAQERAPRVT